MVHVSNVALLMTAAFAAFHEYQSAGRTVSIYKSNSNAALSDYSNFCEQQGQHWFVPQSAADGILLIQTADQIDDAHEWIITKTSFNVGAGTWGGFDVRSAVDGWQCAYGCPNNGPFYAIRRVSNSLCDPQEFGKTTCWDSHSFDFLACQGNPDTRPVFHQYQSAGRTVSMYKSDSSAALSGYLNFCESQGKHWFTPQSAADGILLIQTADAVDSSHEWILTKTSFDVGARTWGGFDVSSAVDGWQCAYGCPNTGPFYAIRRVSNSLCDPQEFGVTRCWDSHSYDFLVCQDNAGSPAFHSYQSVGRTVSIYKSDPNAALSGYSNFCESQGQDWFYPLSQADGILLIQTADQIDDSHEWIITKTSFNVGAGTWGGYDVRSAVDAWSCAHSCPNTGPFYAIRRWSNSLCDPQEFGVTKCWDSGHAYDFLVCQGNVYNAMCGDVQHNDQASRVKYMDLEVNAPNACSSETQYATCNNGNLGSWSGSYQYDSCKVNAMCGDIQHNAQSSRIRYMDPEVNAPYACSSETQYATCNDGILGAWSGSEYAYETCVVRAMCEGDIQHGQKGYRTMYENAVVDYPLTCVSEEQDRLCTDGAFSEWSGSYSISDCSVNYDIDCIVEISECTASCETAAERSVTVLTPQNGEGAACEEPRDCQNRDGACLTDAPTVAPTDCPTPSKGGGLIDVTASEVMPNGRLILDFRYSYAVSEFELAMNAVQFSYSAAIPNDWNVDSDTCVGFINREFTYNQLQQSVDFYVEYGDVYFAVVSSFEYTTTKSITIDGVTHELPETIERSKTLTFKLHVPETTTLSVGVTNNQDSPDPDDFIYPPLKSKSPTISAPTSSPSISAPTTGPSASPTYSEPTLVPTSSDPTNMPTKTPSHDPSYSQPTQSPSISQPSLSPIPDAKVLASIISVVAEETRQLGTHPQVDITYTTVIKMPWSLTNPEAEGNAIAETPTYSELKSGTCDTFTEMPAFLQSPRFYCQTWNLQFGGDKRCSSEARNVAVTYDATEPRGTEEDVELSWGFDLGFSSAFDCSEDLGSFQIAITVEGSSGGNTNFENPGEAYLDDWYYFRIGASSGAPITEINIMALEIMTPQGVPLCENCETIDALQIGVSDYSPDNFIVQLILDSSVFGGHLSTKMEFTFEITMSPERRRRLNVDDPRLVKESVTLYLSPKDYDTKIDAFKPTAAGNPFPPTPRPTQPLLAKSLGGSTDTFTESTSKSSSLIYVGIGGGFLLILALVGGYYWQSKKSNTDLVDFETKDTELSVSRGGEELAEPIVEIS